MFSFDTSSCPVEPLAPCDSHQQWWACWGLWGLSLTAPDFYGNASCFSRSPALVFKLKYVFLVMLGTLFCLLYPVFKDGDGCEILSYAVWCLWWLQPCRVGKTAWSSAYRVSWRGGRLGGRWRLEPPSAAAAAVWYWQKQETGRSMLSPSLPVSRVIWQDTRKAVRVGGLILLTVLETSVHFGGQVWAEQLTLCWTGNRIEQHLEETRIRPNPFQGLCPGPGVSFHSNTSQQLGSLWSGKSPWYALPIFWVVLI